MRIVSACCLLLLAGCAGRGVARYTGAGPACGAPGTATLVRQGDQIVLTPTDGSIVLRGVVGADGSVTAAWSAAPPKQAAKPGGRPPATEVATGTMDATAAHLRFVAAGCDVPLELTRPGG